MQCPEERKGYITAAVILYALLVRIIIEQVVIA